MGGCLLVIMSASNPFDSPVEYLKINKVNFDHFHYGDHRLRLKTCDNGGVDTPLFKLFNYGTLSTKLL